MTQQTEGKKIVFLTILDGTPEELELFAKELGTLDLSKKYEFVISDHKIECIERDELIRVIQNTTACNTDLLKTFRR